MRKGLTLIELVMVLAVLAIIGGILVPNFLTTTDKARLKSDVQTARALRNAIELYRSENGTSVGGTTVAEMITNLVTAGYITDEDDVVLQSPGAVWATNADTAVQVNIAGWQDTTAKNAAYAQLTTAEKLYVTGN